MDPGQSSNLIKTGIALVDLALITLAFYLSYWFRFDDLQRIDEFIWVYYFSAPLTLFLLLQRGALVGFRYKRLRDIVRSTVYALFFSGVVSSTVIYLSKTGDYSRLLFGQYFALAGIFLLFEKYLLKKVYDHYLRKGLMNVRVAMVGFGEKYKEILHELQERPQWGVAAVVVLDPRDHEVNSVIGEIRQKIVDEVYICYPRGDEYHENIDELLMRLEMIGLPVRVALNFDEIQPYYGQHACLLASKPGLMLAPHNLNPDQLLLKRCLDLAGAFVGLIILALMFPIVALAIKIDSTGPILFNQTRVGKGGRPFRIFKFRSMFNDAESRKQEFMDRNLHEGPIFKVENDPRITRVGHFIRKYSIDEVPQFWNVMKGDMSLVGTRPPTLDEVELYEDHHFRRISLKPGLTGYWQVAGRNRVESFEEIVKLDVDYIKNWSFITDLKIILLTLRVVIFPKNGSGI